MSTLFCLFSVKVSVTVYCAVLAFRFPVLTSWTVVIKPKCVTVSWHTHTKLTVLPFVLHHFHMCWALNPVLIHPPVSQKRWKYSSHTHMCLLPFTGSAWDLHRWLPRGYWATIFPELLLLNHIYHSDRIFKFEHPSFAR